MLSAKPWKADAIIRLGLSVLVCVYAGSLVLSVQRYASFGAKASPLLFYPLSAAAFGGLAATLVLISKPWPMEVFARRLMALMVCAYAGLFLGLWVQQLSGISAAGVTIWRVVVAALSFQGAGLILIARFLREHQIGWAPAFGFSDRRGKAVLLGVLAALVFLPLGYGLQVVSALVMKHLPLFPMEPEEQLPVHVLRVSMSWPGRITLGAAAVLLAPVAEEILFRGILYPAIKQAGYPRIALWSTMLLFGVVHGNVAIFVPLAVLALVLTALYERTNNLLAPIVAHALFNTVQLVRLFLLHQV